MYPNRGHQHSYNNTGSRFSNNGVGLGGRGRGQPGISGSSHAQQLPVTQVQVYQTLQAMAYQAPQTQTYQAPLAQDQPTQQVLKAQQEAKALATDQVIKRHRSRVDALEAGGNSKHKEVERLREVMKKANEAYDSFEKKVFSAKQAYELAPEGSLTRKTAKSKYQEAQKEQSKLRISANSAKRAFLHAQKEYNIMLVVNEAEVNRMKLEMGCMVHGASDLQEILRHRPTYS